MDIDLSHEVDDEELKEINSDDIEEDQPEELIIAKTKDGIKDKPKNNQIVVDDTDVEPPSATIAQSETPQTTEVPVDYWELMKKEFNAGIYENDSS